MSHSWILVGLVASAFPLGSAAGQEASLETPACFDLVMGEFSGWADHPADSLYYRPPPRVMLMAPGTEGWGLVDVPVGALPSPHRRSMSRWRLSHDTLRVHWSTGFIGVSATLLRDGESFSGEANPFTDVAGHPRPTAPIEAIPVPCQAPTPSTAALMRRFVRAVPLASNEELAVGEVVPESIPLESRRYGATVLVDGRGWASEARVISLSQSEGDTVRRIRIEYSKDVDVLRLRDAFVELMGPWTSSSDEVGLRGWHWYGRAETMMLIESDTRVLVVLEDPRVG